MKFKGKLKDAALFLNVAQTLKQIEKTCVLHLTPRKVQFILITDTADGFQSTLFEEYRCESLNENKISLQLSLDHLVRSLKSAQLASSVVLRLTKKDGLPCLSLNIEMTPTHSVVVTHDLPIDLITAAQFEIFREPQLPDPEVFIMMPALRGLRNVVERMKNLDDYVTIHANMGGELTFKVENELVSVATFYNNLEHPSLPGRDASTLSADTRAACKVDAKKFTRFLHCHQINPQNVICCIVEDQALVLHVLVDDLYLTYYIPVIAEQLLR